MKKLGIIKQCVNYLMEESKFWLFPIFIALLLLGALLLFAKGSALAPFIYSLF